MSKDHAIVLRCDQELAERLSAAAARQRTSRSEVVREAVLFWLDLTVARDLLEQQPRSA